MIEAFNPELQWIVLAAFTIAFLLAFSVGANDVSNSFGTSVGSKVLTVTQACILATFFEVTGATLLGYEVCDTFRRRMLDYKLYEGSEKELVLGFFSCLIGSSIWNFIATKLKMPISGTHSVIGATIGFALISRGVDSIKWAAMARIVVSWFASPVLSGLCSSIIYVVISKFVLTKSHPLEPGLKILPVFYGITIFINVASLVIGGPEALYLDNIPWWGGVLIASAAGLFAAFCIIQFLVDRLRARIKDEMSINMKPTRLGHDNKSYVLDQDDFSAPPSAKAGSSKDVDPGVSTSPQQPTITTSTSTTTATDRPPVAKKPISLRARQLQYSATKSQAAHASPGVTKIYVSGPGSSKQHHVHRQREDIANVDSDPIVSSMQNLGAQECRVDLSCHTKQFGPDESADTTCEKSGFFMGERLEIYRLFAPLQIMTACFASFAHGTNDVSNAVAPLAPIWFIYVNGKENLNDQTPIWILFFGGIGICTGLWAWGRSVMNTLGSGLTKLTASKGFAIELGAATAVLCATKLGLPISTTHCKVGSVVIVALVASKFCNDNGTIDSGPTNGHDDSRRGDNHRSNQSIDIAGIKEGVQAAIETNNNNNGNNNRDDKASLALGGSRYQTRQMKRPTNTTTETEQVCENNVKDENAVEWGMFGSIVVSWLVTVPFAALSSALTMFILTQALL